MLTCVGVGVEGESAVLDVEGEGVDVQSAGANHSDRTVVIDLAIRIDMYIRHKWGCVFRNAVGRQKKHFTLEISIIILYQSYIKGHVLHIRDHRVTTFTLRFDWLKE